VVPEGLGTALKPAFEPVVVARKPLSEKTVAANVLEHGTGAINVDACRVGDGGEVLTGGGGKLWSHYRDSTEDQAAPKVNTGGRWPANVVLDEEMAEVLDQQTGELTSGSGNTRRKPHQTTSMAGTLNILGEEEVSYGDTGGASRFFKVVSEDATGLPIDDVEERFLYTAKAGKKERPVIERDGKRVSHPTVKPLTLMRYLVRLVTPPGGIILDPFAGSGTTGEAAKLEGFRSILIEKDPDYIDLIKQRLTKGS
jgi:hypothetical protein